MNAKEKIYIEGQEFFPKKEFMFNYFIGSKTWNNKWPRNSQDARYANLIFNL